MGTTAVSSNSHNLSTALDARLEFGLETMPEHRLKVPGFNKKKSSSVNFFIMSVFFKGWFSDVIFY